MLDLHIHTIYSDGENTPEEIRDMVEKKGIEVFSITDHDTILGAKKIKESKAIFIPGIELTAIDPVGREHILGYDIDLEDSELNSVLRRKKETDIENFLLYYETLRKMFGITFSDKEIDKILSRVGNIGKVDLSNLLRRYGYAKNQDEAFDKYLNPMQDTIRSQKKGLTEEECITLLKKAGGYVSLAHPISLDKRYKKQDLKKTYVELKERLIRMKAMGLDAIEIQHINQDSKFRTMLEALAHELNLLESGGTDYHGPNIKPGVELGTGKNNNVNIKRLSLVDKILNK